MCEADDDNNQHIILFKIKLGDMPAARVSRGLSGTEEEERLAPTELEAQLELPCRLRADFVFVYSSAVVISPHKTAIEQTGISI